MPNKSIHFFKGMTLNIWTVVCIKNIQMLHSNVMHIECIVCHWLIKKKCCLSAVLIYYSLTCAFSKKSWSFSFYCFWAVSVPLQQFILVSRHAKMNVLCLYVPFRWLITPWFSSQSTALACRRWWVPCSVWERVWEYCFHACYFWLSVKEL